MSLIHLYRAPVLTEAGRNELLSLIHIKVSPHIKGIETEYCFNIEISGPLTDDEKLCTKI